MFFPPAAFGHGLSSVRNTLSIFNHEIAKPYSSWEFTTTSSGTSPNPLLELSLLIPSIALYIPPLWHIDPFKGRYFWLNASLPLLPISSILEEPMSICSPLSDDPIPRITSGNSRKVFKVADTFWTLRAVITHNGSPSHAYWVGITAYSSCVGFWQLL